MKKLFEIYTESNTINLEEIQNFIEEASTASNGCSFDEIARLVYQNENGKNTLVECQVPTKDGIENGMTEIELTAYEFEGEFEDYMAEYEVMSKTFDLNWETLENQMLEMAITE